MWRLRRFPSANNRPDGGDAKPALIRLSANAFLDRVVPLLECEKLARVTRRTGLQWQ
jgi:hypothetical protein